MKLLKYELPKQLVISLTTDEWLTIKQALFSSAQTHKEFFTKPIEIPVGLREDTSACREAAAGVQAYSRRQYALAQKIHNELVRFLYHPDPPPSDSLLPSLQPEDQGAILEVAA